MRLKLATVVWVLLALIPAGPSVARAGEMPGLGNVSSSTQEVFPAEHLHGEQCGHFFYGGAWHLFPRDHLHRSACGHYFVNGRWDYFPSAHQHSIDCGHYFYNGMWNPFLPGHTHGEGCGHYFYDGCWHTSPQGHVHRTACGHAFIDGEWRVGEAPPPESESWVESPGEVAQREATETAAERLLEPRLPPIRRPPLRPPEPPRDRLIVPVPEEEIDPPILPLDQGYSKTVVLRGPRAPVIVVMPGRHVHGRGCGHYYSSGLWNTSPPMGYYGYSSTACGEYVPARPYGRYFPPSCRNAPIRVVVPQDCVRGLRLRFVIGAP